jgi:hypothetical protein
MSPESNLQGATNSNMGSLLAIQENANFDKNYKESSVD